MNKKLLFFAASAFLCCSPSGYSALTLVKVTDISLGNVLAGPSGRQWVVNTSGSVSGTGSGDYISGAQAGEILISDTTAPASAQIQAINITGTGGLSVNQITCSYNSGVEARCDQSGYIVITGTLATSLKLGIDLQSTQFHNGGDSPQADFDIEITYQ
jgi:hypothetical protein